MLPRSMHINLLTALTMGCIFFLSCENDVATVKKLTQKKTGVEEAKNVIVKYSVAGKSKATLTGPLMYSVQDTNNYIEFPKTVHADFYNDAEIIESKMDAMYAKYRQNQNVVFLRDSVTVINIQKGDTLMCNELYWDRTKIGKEFYTDKPVKIRTKTETINGLGLEASQDFKNWRILHSVGTIAVPASKFPG